MQRAVAEEQRATAQAETRRAESETLRANDGERDARQEKVEADRQRGIATEQSRLARLREEEARSGKAEAERRTVEAVQAREAGLTAESLTLANLSRRLTDEGRVDLAQATALEAMPRSLDPPDRPVVGLAFEAFKRASQFDPVLAQWTARDGRNPISVLFTPGGRELVVGTSSGYLLIYDLEERRIRHRVFIAADLVTELALSTDGTRVVASGSKQPKVVEIATGRVVYTLPESETRYYKTAVFTADGRFLVAGAANNTITVLDAQTGQRIRTIKGPDFEAGYERYRALTGNTDGADPIVTAVQSGIHSLSGGATLVAVSPDSTLIASAGPADSMSAVRLYDLATGQPVAELLGHRKPMGFLAGVTGLTFSRDGSLLVSGSDDGTARIWDVRTKTVRHVLNGWSPVTAVDLNGTRLLTAHQDGSARLWNMEDGSQIALLHGHAHAITFARFSPDGDIVATTSWDNSARLWSGHTGAPLATVPGNGVFHEVAFADDGKRLATVSRDGQVRLLRSESPGNAILRRPATDGRAIAGTLPELSAIDPAVHLGFSLDGTRVVTTSPEYDKLALWDLERRAWLGDVEGKRFAHRRPDTTEIATYRTPLKPGFPAVEMQPDGSGRWVLPRDPENEGPFRRRNERSIYDFDWVVRGDGKRAIGVPDWVDPDVKSEMLGSRDKHPLKLIDTESRKGLADLVVDGWTGSARFTRDGAKVIARLNTPKEWRSDDGRRFAVWDAGTGAFLGASPDIDRDTDLFDPSLDGRFVAIARQGQFWVTVFDTTQGWRRWDTYLDDEITAIGLSNGGAFLAVGTLHGRVEVIDTRRAFTTVASAQPSQKAIRRVVISEDDRLVAAADEIGTVTVSSRENGTLLSEARLAKPPRVMRFSPQSDRLVSLLADGSLHVLTDGFGKWDIGTDADIVDWGHGNGASSLSPLDRIRLNIASDGRRRPDGAIRTPVPPAPLALPRSAARVARSPALARCDLAAGDPLDRDRQADVASRPIADPAAALGACDAALNEAPTDRLLRYQRGRALLALGRRAEALLAFREAAQAGHAAAMWTLSRNLSDTAEALPEMGTAADWLARAVAAGDTSALSLRARELAETADSDAALTEAFRYGFAAVNVRPATMVFLLGTDIETARAVTGWRRRALRLYEIGLALAETETEAPPSREEPWRATAIENLRNHVRVMPKTEVIAMRRDAVRFVQAAFLQGRTDPPKP
ncbi:hypothetical protein HPGCJGGD_4240 [Methylobacterium haplocladii]|uniref:hypothetical protein n=1 Tax=Methylobacterium haplocladii TaxID=1176176 RepID=UPI001EDD10A3|nr:hypothetical protein [Methylobacterium haplocladii]GJD86334.1 hypothetical protein HPGCJGGD_4240 [Methylobacterium haplocladii]